MKAMPTNLKKFLDANPTLRAVLVKRDDGVQQYTIECTVCLEDVWVRAVSEEGAAFGMYEGEFDNRKLSIIETEIELRCECKEKTYERPEGYEISWG